jgi:hypothetical protein
MIDATCPTVAGRFTGGRQEEKMKVTSITALAVVLGGAVLSAAGAAAGPSSARGIIDCKGMAGARWHVGGQTGTHYDAAAQGVSCAFVRTYVLRLEGPPHPNGNLRGGPPGWTCISANRYFLRCQNAANSKVVTIHPAAN